MNPEIGVAFDHQGLSLAEVFDRAAAAEELGAAAVWLVQLPNQRDSGTLLAALACRTSRCAIGSAILPLYTRPPVVAAYTALTIDELSGGRFTLGLGLGHRGVGEWMVGAGVSPPAVAGMREYLHIVGTLIRDGEVNHDGKWFSGHSACPAGLPRRADLPLYLGGFGRKMIELAGELADGVILWMCTPGYVSQDAMPALRAGWARRTDGRHPAGAGFGVAVMVNAAVTSRQDDNSERYGQFLTAHLRVPTYRRLFAASGFTEQVRTGRSDQAMVRALVATGPPDQVRARLAEYASAGATHIAVVPAADGRDDSPCFAGTLRAALP